MDSQSALKELNTARSTAKGAGDIYKETSQELGVGASQQRAQELRKLITGTEQALRGVESSVTGRTQGSLVTEAQRSRLANIERQPIADQFSTQQNALSDEQQTYRDMLAEASNRTGLTYTSQQDRIKSLEGTYQGALEEEARRRQEEYNRQQALESRRQFEANLALERSKLDVERQKNATQNKYDIDSILRGLNDRQKSINSQPQLSLSSIFGTGLSVKPITTPTISSVGVATPGRISSVGVAQPTGTLRVR